jgi:hypothetical protein
MGVQTEIEAAAAAASSKFATDGEQSEASDRDDDRGLAEAASAMLSQLSSCSQVGADGELQEWLDGSPQVDPGHRHWSHLFGLYVIASVSPSTLTSLPRHAL